MRQPCLVLRLRVCALACKVENLEPVEFVEGLTPKVKERMPFLAEEDKIA